MTPNAAQFNKLLNEYFSKYFSSLPDGDPTKEEKRMIISCVLASAEAVEKLEKVVREVIGPALNALMQEKTGTIPVKKEDAPTTATATAPAVEPEAEMPPLRATTTVSGPAKPPAATTSSKVVMQPSANGTLQQ